jgi:hypothetical protein
VEAYQFLNGDGTLLLPSLGLIGPLNDAATKAVPGVGTPLFNVATANGRVRMYVLNPELHVQELAGAFGKLRAGETVAIMLGSPNIVGYWLITSQGRVFTFGAAKSYGDLNGRPLNGPIVGAALSRDEKGYYFVGSDGGVFAFGSARFFGSMGGRHLNARIVGMAPSIGDQPGVNDGYYLVAEDGGVFSFRAFFHGSMGGRHLNAPMSGMAPCGSGYVLAARDGGVFNFSDHPFHGSAVGRFAHPDVVQISVTTTIP